MGWFGLFDLLRFQTDDAVPSGWALPGSRLRVADRHLAALYHGAVTDAGQHYCADLFDLASHHIARSSPPQTGVFHVDMRMTGRPARLLFGSDHTQSIVAWHAPTATASVRLAGAEPPVEFPQVDLPKLLQLTLPICQIATLSAWVEDFHGVEAVMKLLDPWLTTSSRAIVRLPQSALAAMLARLPAWPARGVAVVPCSNAAQKTGGNETVDDVIVCFQDISAQTPKAATAAEQKRVRVIAADTWNDKPRGQRARSQGGVGVQMPSDHPRPISGLPITLLGDAPANPAGTSFAAMQSRPFQPSTGFDYLLDISAATILRRDTSLFIVPQHGPAVIDPAQALEADADDFSPDAIKRFHAAHYLSETGGLATSSRLAATLATRPTLLLSTATSPLSHLTQSWPNLQHLFELCDRERLALDEVDVLVPDAATPWVIDSLLHSGLTPGQIRHDFDRVLFRRLLVANPASQASGPQRAAIFDRFWARHAASSGRAAFVSFSKPLPSGKVMLVDPVTSPIVNGVDLQTMARDRGYQIVSTAAASMTEMIAALTGARVVIGPGTLLGWTCLASQATLGLLHRSGDPVLPYPALHAASARGHAMVVMFCTSIGSADQAAFVVAPDRFTALMDRVEAAGLTRRPRLDGVA